MARISASRSPPNPRANGSSGPAITICRSCRSGLLDRRFLGRWTGPEFEHHVADAGYRAPGAREVVDAVGADHGQLFAEHRHFFFHALWQFNRDELISGRRDGLHAAGTGAAADPI